MKVLFRTDAAHHIGSGHVMRCLTLAHTLRAAGHDCAFLCRPHSGHLIDAIQQQGFTVTALPLGSSTETNAHKPPHAAWLKGSQADDAAACIALLKHHPCDWLIVDHYALDIQWEKALRPYCHHLMVIDDLADRQHDCDLLLDQNLGRLAQDYAPWLPPYCASLIGTQYALLRPEFAQWRTYSLQRRQYTQNKPKHLFINLGGVDHANHTHTVLMALAQAAHKCTDNWQITIAMGATAPHLNTIQQQAQLLPWPTQVQVNAHNMAELMAQADLAIGAAGSTAWERCCLGLPTVVLVLADNQHAIAQHLQAVGAAHYLDINQPTFKQHLMDLLLQTDGTTWAEISQQAAALVDGNGSHRVMECMAQTSHPSSTLRPVTEADVAQIWQWRNHPDIRRWMFQTQEISLEQHWQWYRNQSHDHNVHLCIFSRGAAQGFVHFRHLGSQVYEWGFYLSPNSPAGNGYYLGRSALNYAFNKLNAHKIYARVLVYNTRSQALHHKLHFSQEGYLHQHHYDGAQYWDIIEFGLLAENHHQKNTHEPN